MRVCLGELHTDYSDDPLTVFHDYFSFYYDPQYPFRYLPQLALFPCRHFYTFMFAKVYRRCSCSICSNVF